MTTLKAQATEAARELAVMAARESDEIIALLIWKMRHSLPALVVQITQADREAFKQSLEYNEQVVKVNVEDRHGTTLVHLTDEKTGDQIIVTENNEADLDKGEAAKRLRMVKQSAPDLANQLRRDIASGSWADSMIEEVCSALVTLGRS